MAKQNMSGVYGNWDCCDVEPDVVRSLECPVRTGECGDADSAPSFLWHMAGKLCATAIELLDNHAAFAHTGSTHPAHGFVW